MTVWPLKFRDLKSGTIVADDAGGWFIADRSFVDRYGRARLTETDMAFLSDGGHAFAEDGDLDHLAFAWRWSARQANAGPLAYVILVPTLRCNLTCGYCQVSRAPESARGFDWTDEILSATLAFLDGLAADSVKIEFQGGEPTLRLDHLRAVRDFVRQRFERSTFVVCTNLQRLGPEEWAFLDAPDTFVSTSLDGDFATHDQQRAMNHGLTRDFYENVREAAARLRPGHLSALPTVDPFRPPDLAGLVDLYESLGLTSIYLRPINHQGFARRRPKRDGQAAVWNALHGDFIDFLIRRNAETGRFVEEYGFSHALRRVLAPGRDNDVDLRNPNLFATSYLLVDHDGTLFPTDEARMLSRIGQVDLSVGHVFGGVDPHRKAVLNTACTNNFDPDCVHCPYQPFCGSDGVDDLSRYGRLDLPRHETWFCQRHTALFDKVFDLLARDDEPTRRSLARWAGVAEWPRTLVRRLP